MFLYGSGLCNVQIAAILQAACSGLLNFTIKSLPVLPKCISFSELYFKINFDKLVLNNTFW